MTDEELREMLAGVTGGRRYCFVVMTWHANYAVFMAVQKIVQDATGLRCIRADDVPQAGDLLAKIHYAIDHAVMVIADIGDQRPNIYYEVGYAMARGKGLLLLAGEKSGVPENLKGMETIQYDLGTAQGYEHFERKLKEHMAPYTPRLLRGMIIPPRPDPSYILVERKPFVPRPDRRLPDERRTYGDYLGVVGVLRAFGSVYGEQVEPELLTASQTVPQLLEEDASFYSIASDKVNDWTPRLMEKLQNGRSPNWMFAARPGEEDKPRADAEYAIHSDGRTMDPLYPREARPPYSEKSYEDYGLIVRGPKPGHPGRMLTVLAGAHSLGTGAACLAATKSDLVEKIQKQLGSKCDLSTCEQTMWALVKGVSDGDRHIDAKGVSIVDAGVY